MHARKLFSTKPLALYSLAALLVMPYPLAAQPSDADSASDLAPQTGQDSSIAGKLDDAQILQVIRVLNDGEIEQAELALEQSATSEVTALADMLIGEHRDSNKQIDGLADAELELQTSTLSDGLQSLAEVTLENLALLGSADFDCIYLQEQANQHQLALDTVNSHLLPNASDSEVQAFLTMTTQSLEQHLQEVREALKALEQCSARL